MFLKGSLSWVITGCLLFLQTGIGAQDVESKNLSPYFLFELTGVDPWSGARQSFMMPVPDSGLHMLYQKLDNDFYLPGKWGNIKPSGPAILGVRLHQQNNYVSLLPVRSYSKEFPAWHVGDSSGVMVIAAGISTDNYKDYRYHAVLDDSSEIVPWTAVTDLQQQHRAKKPYAFLGNYQYPGHQVLIEVVNTTDYSLRDGVVVNWKTSRKPELKQVILMRSYDYFNINFTPRSGKFLLGSNYMREERGKLRLPVDTIEEIMFEFASHESIPYEIRLNRTTNGSTKNVFTSIINDNRYSLEGERYREPGTYEALFYFAYYDDELDKHADEIVRFEFEVYDPRAEEQKFSIRELVPYLLGLLGFLAIIIYLYYRYNKRKLAKFALQKKLSQLQLKSVRSQLNPHFLFNALTSIQNLINKNDAEGANLYLSKFAGLTRTILASSEEELISLEEELAMQHTYLQMEQLRYPFQYNIAVEDSINLANTEIPHMLLQPFIENAVKHGVASLKQDGRINILVRKVDISLIMEVRDNGPGFDPMKPANGNTRMGLKLSRERVRLLNEVYRSEMITMEMHSSADGTSIIIQLNDWLP